MLVTRKTELRTQFVHLSGIQLRSLCGQAQQRQKQVTMLKLGAAVVARSGSWPIVVLGPQTSFGPTSQILPGHPFPTLAFLRLHNLSKVGRRMSGTAVLTGTRHLKGSVPVAPNPPFLVCIP